MVSKETQGLGILDTLGLSNNTNQPKGNNKANETKVKKARNYFISTETIKQIEALKYFIYPELSREQIIEEAIQELYKKKYKKIELQNELED